MYNYTCNLVPRVFFVMAREKREDPISFPEPAILGKETKALG
jgi:hypothetical protein